MSTNKQDGDDNFNAQFKGTDLDLSDYMGTTLGRMRMVMLGLAIILMVACLGLIVGAPACAGCAGHFWGDLELRFKWIAMGVGCFTVSTTLLAVTAALLVRYCKIALHRDLLHGLPVVTPESNHEKKDETK